MCGMRRGLFGSREMGLGGDEGIGGDRKIERMARNKL